MDWQEYYDGVAPGIAGEVLARVPEWQRALTAEVRDLVGAGRLLEAGSGFGVTSLLAGPGAERTLLDLVPKAVQVARAEFRAAGQCAHFVVGDLLRLPFPDERFDVAFNSGVIEHLGFAARRQALAEMVRVVRPGGAVLVGFPNHYSRPYGFAYRARVRRGTWRYPLEERLYDLAEELAGVPEVAEVQRRTCDVGSALRWLNWRQRILFRALGLVTRFEGYLTIIVLRRAARSPAP